MPLVIIAVIVATCLQERICRGAYSGSQDPMNLSQGV